MTEEERARLDELIHRGKQLHRRILEPSVLRGTLPLRAHAVRQAAQQPEARDREQRFRQVSSSYARVVDDAGHIGPEARVLAIDSLTRPL